MGSHGSIEQPHLALILLNARLGLGFWVDLDGNEMNAMTAYFS